MSAAQKPCLVALETFRDVEFGITFYAGISCADPDGPFVANNPRKFGREAKTVDTASYEADEAARKAAREEWVDGYRARARSAPGLMRVAGDGIALGDRVRSETEHQRRSTGIAVRERPKSQRGDKSTEELLARGRTLRAVPDLDLIEVPDLRADATPSLTISVSSFARETINGELTRSRDLFDLNFETGGWLFGFRDGAKWFVSSATDLGAGKREVNTMKLDVNHALRAAAYHASLDLRGAPTRLLGAWHVHPSVGSTKPSVTDRRGSGLRLEERDLNPARFALDLIISPHKDRGWFAPEYTAWTTQRNVFGSLVTEPVTIERPRR